MSPGYIIEGVIKSFLNDILGIPLIGPSKTGATNTYIHHATNREALWELDSTTIVN